VLPRQNPAKLRCFRRQKSNAAHLAALSLYPKSRLTASNPRQLGTSAQSNKQRSDLKRKLEAHLASELGNADVERGSVQYIARVQVQRARVGKQTRLADCSRDHRSNEQHANNRTASVSALVGLAQGRARQAERHARDRSNGAWRAGDRLAQAAAAEASRLRQRADRLSLMRLEGSTRIE